VLQDLCFKFSVQEADDVLSKVRIYVLFCRFVRHKPTVMLLPFCVLSGCRHDVNELFVLLACYSA